MHRHIFLKEQEEVKVQTLKRQTLTPEIFPLRSVSIRLYNNVTQTLVPKFKVQILNMTFVPRMHIAVH